MTKSTNTAIVVFSIFTAIGVLGLLFTDTELPTWRIYSISAVYGVGTYHLLVWCWKDIFGGS